MAKAKRIEGVEALIAVAPNATKPLQELEALIAAPSNHGGSDQHAAEERRLDQLAIELGVLIPAEHHAELGALLDHCRLSLKA